MTATSPCPACAGPVSTFIQGGAVVRGRCLHCSPPRSFFRDAVASALPSIIAEVKAEVSAASGLDPSCFEIVPLPDDGPERVTTTVHFSGEACSTCGRAEKLFESVEECRDASPGACRNALRRVE